MRTLISPVQTVSSHYSAMVRPIAGETDLGGFLQLLGRNIWRIVAATVLTTALAAAYLLVAKPVYTATASIFIDPRSSKIVPEAPNPTGYGTDLALVESQAAILTSDAVLRRVVDKLDLARDEDYAPIYGQGVLSRIKALIIARPPPPDPTSLAIGTLADSIRIKRAAKSYVVDIEVSAKSAVLAATVAGAVVDAYLADQTAAKSAEAKRANALLDARLGELREQVRLAENRFDDFKKANRILTSEGGVVTEQQLTKLGGELITARGVAAESKARQDQLLAALKSGAGPESLPDAVRSGLVQRLREQYSQVARREAALSSQLQARHPVLIDVRSQLAEVEQQIKDELKRVATAARSEYAIAASRERNLAAQLETAKAEVARSNTAQIKVRELEQDVAASRELLKLFLSRAKETQEEQNISTPDARIITPPAVPARPSRPISWLVLGLGLLGGLGLGIASVLLGDHIGGNPRTASAFAAETGLTHVAPIPAVGAAGTTARMGNRTSTSADRIEAAQFSDLLSAIADTKGSSQLAYRQAVLRLTSRIKGHQKPGRPHTVMFVAPSGGSGNSATTLAVAYAAALSGDRVLLVDATSTNPELSTVFATTLKPTNVIVLDNKDHLNEITTRDARSGLAFLPIALADLRILKTQQRRRLIAGLNGISQNYDLIVIDAGGLLQDEAATCLLPAADQVLIVARAGVTSASDVAETLDLLSAARDRLTGAVLTMAEPELT